MIYTKVEIFYVSLFSDKLRKKLYISLSFFLCVKMPEPWIVFIEMKVCNGLDIWIQKSFENELTHVLILVIIFTKIIHFEHLDGRIALYNLFIQNYHLNILRLRQFTHVA